MITMQLPRLYVNACLLQGQSVQLDQQYYARLSRVLRMRRGQALRVFGNDGREYQAKIAHLQRHGVHIDVGERIDVHRESPLSLSLAAAVIRPRSLDIVLQKAVELGVQSCVLLYTEHSQLRYDEKTWRRRHRHWRRLIISATEQCQRVRLCTLHPPRDFCDWLTSHQDDRAMHLILDPGCRAALPPLLTGDRKVTLIIGPEGGFTEQELSLARNNGCTAFSLGPRILRAETAALCAAGICQAWYGDYFS